MFPSYIKIFFGNIEFTVSSFHISSFIITRSSGNKSDELLLPASEFLEIDVLIEMADARIN